MGTFSNAITDNGRTLLSHVQAGAVFTPTKIVIGSGSIPTGKTVRTITDVATPVQTLTISKKKRGNDGTVTIGGVYSNEEVAADFYFRELGLYAKAVYENGTEIDEVLYSYGNAGATADLMPAYTSGQPVEREIDLVTYIGNDTAVDLTIESGVYATQGKVQEMIDASLDEFDAGSFHVVEVGLPMPTQLEDKNLYFKGSGHDSDFVEGTFIDSRGRSLFPETRTHKVLDPNGKTLNEVFNGFFTSTDIKTATLAASATKVTADVSDFVTAAGLTNHVYGIVILSSTAEGETPVATVYSQLIGSTAVFYRGNVNASKAIEISFKIVGLKIITAI